ncbi:MAG: hypothetical protein AVDCRST_MAG85-779, partial [uncultured Solirubrobacteraceae bacterium]
RRLRRRLGRARARARRPLALDAQRRQQAYRVRGQGLPPRPPAVHDHELQRAAQVRSRPRRQADPPHDRAVGQGGEGRHPDLALQGSARDADHHRPRAGRGRQRAAQRRPARARRAHPGAADRGPGRAV